MNARRLSFGISFLLFVIAAPGVRANDSDLDTSFGVGGIAFAGITDDSGGISKCRPVVQPDGKILICGTRLANGSSGSDFFVERFTADGQADTDFSFDGQATIDFDGGTGRDTAIALALQSDGRIVIVGTTNADGISGNDNFAIARLTSDGLLDTSFGAGTGKKIVGFDLDAGTGDDDAADVAIQSDGKIVVAGTVATSSEGKDFGILRLLGDGTPDSAFNLTGKVSVGFDLPQSTSFDDVASSMAIDSAGRIVVAGSASNGPAQESDYAVARLMPNGQLDANFDADGRATVAFDAGASGSDTCYGMALQSDGKIVLSGNVDVSPTSAQQNLDIGVARLRPDGSPDATFGSVGRTLVTFDLIPNGIDYGLDVAVQADGRLVLAGAAQYGDPSNGSIYAAAVRLLGDGSLDPDFGTLGRRTYDFGLTSPSSQAFLGATIQADDILMSGIAIVPGVSGVDAFVVRLRDDTLFADGFDG